MPATATQGAIAGLLLHQLWRALGLPAGGDRAPEAAEQTAAVLASPPSQSDVMKLPEGWRIYALVLGLNVLALSLWWVDRDAVPHPSAGGMGAWIAARLGS